MGNNKAGFTLLEIILALSILATIGIITINILSGQIATRQKLADLNTEQHTLDATLNHITQDLQGAYLPDQKIISSLNLPNRPIVPRFYLKNENLIFFTQAFKSFLRDSNQGNQAFIRYTIKPDNDNSRKKQLIRAVDTDLIVSIEQTDVGIAEILIDDLESFKVEFWDGNKFRPEWDSSSGDTQNKMPKMVKIHLSLYSIEKPEQLQPENQIAKRKNFSLDTIVFLSNTQGQKEATAPTWSNYKWE